MIKEAMMYLMDLSAPETVTIDPVEVDSNLVLAKGNYKTVVPPSAECLRLATLASMRAFVEACGGAKFSLLLVVGNDTQVELYGPLHPLYRTREALAVCDGPLTDPITGIHGSDALWMPPESMIPAIMVAFEESDERAALLKVIGNISDGATRSYQDDGVTQLVATRKGIGMKDMEELPSPLTLIPRANYFELDNVPQQYILRARGGEDGCKAALKLLRINDPAFFYLRREMIVKYLSDLGVPVV